MDVEYLPYIFALSLIPASSLLKEEENEKNFEKRVKKYVKLLKGKGLRSDLVFCMLLSRGWPLQFTGPASV